MWIALYMGGDMARGSRKTLISTEPAELSPPSFRVLEDRWVRLMGVRFLVPAGTTSSKIEQIWIDHEIPYEQIGGANGINQHGEG